MLSRRVWHSACLPGLLKLSDSSVEVLRAVRDGFERSGYLCLRDVACGITSGVVKLEGRVSSYYVKPVAQAIAGATPGVRGVTNQIIVVAPSRDARGDRASLRAGVCGRPARPSSSTDRGRNS